MAYSGSAKKRVEKARKTGASGVVFVREQDDPRGEIHLSWFGEDEQSLDLRFKVASALGLDRLSQGHEAN
jgi:hypothetical protein